MGRFLKGTTAWLMTLVCITAGAQTTKTRGRVTDTQGEGIPFAAVYFQGTTTGITTDLDGYYSLENRNLSDSVLVAQMLGYDTVEKTITPGHFHNTDFTLVLTDNRLSGATVKADNRKARELLANIQKHRARNDPDNHPEYTCKVYNKMEMDLTHPEEQLRGRRFRKELGFVFDYIDTSSVSGVPYLPVMISETVAQKVHSSRPSHDSEVVQANRISGINPDGNNMLSQFTGSLHLKVNFYRPFINAFDVQFPSPIQEDGLLYYNYYIIDTLAMDGRKTLLVRYHPKRLLSTPAFDGEMRIDLEDFALKSIHANMKNVTNVNWLRDLVLDSEYARQEDSTWFYKSDRLYADLSLSLRDSSKMLSFIGRKEMVFSDVRFEKTVSTGIGTAMVSVDEDASLKDEGYWAKERPVPLSEKEQEIYGMVDKVKGVRMFQTMYDVVYTAVNGYYEMGPVGIGPYFRLFSFNPLEGARFQFGARTSKDFSRKDRFTVFAAYGTLDRTFKGGATWEHLFRRIPERKLTLDARYDTYQLGSGLSKLHDSNILASIFGSNNDRLTMKSSFSAIYQHEFSTFLNAEAGVDLKRFWPSEQSWVKPKLQVPMYAPDSTRIGSVAANEMWVSLRFCKDETVNRGLFKKTHVYSDHPAITLSLAGSVGGLREGDYSYLRPEFTLRWNPRIPPFGISKIYVNAGKIFGQVPYPLLHLHEGNSTYLQDRFSFACMDFMEFASDEWVTIFWNHCYNGFFFGKVPLLRKLGWREETSVKATWGSLSDANNGNPARFSAARMKAPMLFPNGTSSLGKTPYIEFGLGISNILKFIRVDAYWRASHRDERVVVVETDSALEEKIVSKIKTPNFAVKIGAEFRF